jgi:hypothetical protein
VPGSCQGHGLSSLSWDGSRARPPLPLSRCTGAEPWTCACSILYSPFPSMCQSSTSVSLKCCRATWYTHLAHTVPSQCSSVGTSPAFLHCFFLGGDTSQKCLDTPSKPAWWAVSHPLREPQGQGPQDPTAIGKLWSHGWPSCTHIHAKPAPQVLRKARWLT